MLHTIDTVETDTYRVGIGYDTNPFNPREDDNLGTMVCSHRRYDLGDEVAQNLDDYTSWDEWREGEVPADAIVVLPLGLYDHSGISMFVGTKGGGVHAAWDSGQVGWVYATPADCERMGSPTDPESVERILRGEVETYDAYLRGEVYGYTVSKVSECECCNHKEYEHQTSVGGFYTYEDARDCARDEVDDATAEIIK